jgi:acetyl esterase
MELDPDAVALIAAYREANRTPRHLEGVAVARERARRIPAGPRSDERVEVIDVDVPGAIDVRRARVYRPRSGGEFASVVYLHGGGWALGDLEINDGVCRTVAAACGVVLVSLDYRLAPEHPFPAALDDAHTLLEYLATEPILRSDDGGALAPLPKTLAVAGLSAGGALATALARRSRDGLAPPVAAHFVFCPVLDCDLERDSYFSFGEGLVLTRDDMIWFWQMYLPAEAARVDPDASPLRAASMAGLSPAIVIIAGADPLRDEAVEYCHKLRSAGVDVTELLVPGVPHGCVARPEIASSAAALRIGMKRFRELVEAAASTGAP